MRSTSSSSFDVSLLDSVVSVRGALLTLREDSWLWVLRAGGDPRAWKLKLDARGNGIGGWRHARPRADAWLRPGEEFVAARQRLHQELGECVALHMQPHRHASVEEMRHRREVLRRILKLDRLILWTRCFPRNALEFLERHHFQSRRWHLLNLWLRAPDGRELFDDVPALAWLAASSWCFKTHAVQRPLRSLRSLVKKPRAHLLRWLELPDGDGIVRLLRTVRPRDLNPMQAAAICRVLRDEPRRRWWRSLPQPAGADAVHLLAYRMPLSFPLIRVISEGRNVGADGQEMSVAQVLDDTMRMLHILQRMERREVIARIESPERLLEEHDRLAHDFALLRAARDGTGGRMSGHVLAKEMPPPLAPAPWMRPITNITDLLREGDEMHHCVASYESGVAARSFYVYAVHHPSGRATLGIRRDDRGRWALAELRGPYNARVPRAVFTDIQAWLPLASSRHDEKVENEVPLTPVSQSAC